MTKKLLISTFCLIVIQVGAMAQVKSGIPANYQETSIGLTDLLKWPFYGQGSAFDETHGQICLAETEGSKGAMIVSPATYGTRFIIQYDVMALTSATVFVVLINASDTGKTANLNFPSGYDGNMDYLTKNAENYFIAFRNSPHNFTPFVRKYPAPGIKAIASAEKDEMLPGVYYRIEIGRDNEKIWLSIDGKKQFEAIDKNMLGPGQIAFRVRGTAGFRAAGLIKDLKIYTPK